MKKFSIENMSKSLEWLPLIGFEKFPIGVILIVIIIIGGRIIIKRMDCNHLQNIKDKEIELSLKMKEMEIRDKLQNEKIP